MINRAQLTARVKEEARSAGFARCGVAEARALREEGAHLDAWLAEGYHGQMTWMERNAAVRKDPGHPGMVPGARSVVVLAAAYPRQHGYAGPPPGRVAKYALGRDYHNVLAKRARRVARLLQEQGHEARTAVDSKPVFERAWAERAGVGFIGKNCCLIVPGVGSHVFLACVVTSAELSADEPIRRRCGSCTACLDSCPTRAFVGPRTLDARKCISYLTIEHRGTLPAEHRQQMGPWLFGCDVCQDVCPYNQGAGVHGAMAAFEPGERWSAVAAADFLRMTEQEFAAWAEGSPLKRAGSEGLARNAAIVLGNRGSKRHLPLLEEIGQSHRSAAVREAAAWAVQALKPRVAASK